VRAAFPIPGQMESAVPKNRFAVFAVLLFIIITLVLVWSSEAEGEPKVDPPAPPLVLAPSPAERLDLTPVAEWLAGIELANTKAFLEVDRAAKIAAEKERQRKAAEAARARNSAASSPVSAAAVSGPLPAVLWEIAKCEGYPNYVYADHGPESTASGKFGFLDGTWRTWRGEEGAQYARAMHAPEHIQDAAAIRLYNDAGTTPWNASRSCWG
jgi:hypothetical protein